MVVSVEGKYALEKSENFDEYLKSCGLNYLKRSIAAKMKPVLEISRDGDHWVLKTVTPLKTILIKFVLGEEFEMEFPDESGRKMKTRVDKDGENKIVTTNLFEGDTIKDEKIFSEDGLVATITKGDIVCVRRYKRIPS